MNCHYLKKYIIGFVAVTSALLLFCSQNPTSVSEKSFDWPASTLSAEGFDTSKFSSAIKYIEDTVKGVRSMVVIRNGKLVYERYYHMYYQDTTYQLNSVTKNIISILTGIAIRDSLIKGGVKAKVLDFFPEKQFQNCTEYKKNMTIEDLLTMRNGLKWDDNTDNFFDNPDPVQYILDKPMDTMPGVEWNYNSGGPHILSAIIAKVSGKSTFQFAKEKLFNPLDITTFNWEVDSKGVFIGGYGLYLKPKDLAKIGVMFLNKGVWDNTKILPENWVKTSTDSITPTYWPENGSYGYAWWINYFGGYAARGAYGQALYVFPDKQLIIVFTSGLEITKADLMLNVIVSEHILPSVH